ncbi:DNA glycosylase, partial [Sesbania bispinosa]
NVNEAETSNVEVGKVSSYSQQHQKVAETLNKFTYYHTDHGRKSVNIEVEENGEHHRKVPGDRKVSPYFPSDKKVIAEAAENGNETIARKLSRYFPQHRKVYGDIKDSCYYQDDKKVIPQAAENVNEAETSNVEVGKVSSYSQQHQKVAETLNKFTYYHTDHGRKSVNIEVEENGEHHRKVPGDRKVSPYFPSDKKVIAEAAENGNQTETNNVIIARKLSRYFPQHQKVSGDIKDSCYYQDDKKVIPQVEENINEAETSNVKVGKVSSYSQQHQKVAETLNKFTYYHTDHGRKSVNIEVEENEEHHRKVPGDRKVSPYFPNDKKVIAEAAENGNETIARKLSRYFPQHQKVSGDIKDSCYYQDDKKVIPQAAEKVNEAETSNVKVGKVSSYSQQHQKVAETLNKFTYYHTDHGRKSVNIEVEENGDELQCLAGSKHIEEAKRKRKSTEVAIKKTLSASQKFDEAYKRKAPDNTWVPPRSHLHLIQEDHFRDPWRVLVICMLLNLTTGKQVRQVVLEFFKLCPDAKACTQVTTEEIERVIWTLGLRKRAAALQRLSQEYLEESWTHVTQLHGVGKRRWKCMIGKGNKEATGMEVVRGKGGEESGNRKRKNWGGKTLTKREDNSPKMGIKTPHTWRGKVHKGRGWPPGGGGNLSPQEEATVLRFLC